jgi:transcriptional regulator with XRE-family HTH domain
MEHQPEAFASQVARNMAAAMEPEAFASHVARNVAAAMERAGLSQRAVADATGIALPTLSRRLKALPGRKSFDMDELYAIAPVVGVAVECLVAVA